MIGITLRSSALLTLALMLVLQVPGCFTVRVRAVHWPGMLVRREFTWWLRAPQPMLYPYIQIDLRANPKPFFVKMPNGTIFASKDCTFERLKPYFTHTEKLGPTYLPDTSRGIIEFDQGHIDVSM